jgi:hypothetical protein
VTKIEFTVYETIHIVVCLLIIGYFLGFIVHSPNEAYDRAVVENFYTSLDEWDGIDLFCARNGFDGGGARGFFNDTPSRDYSMYGNNAYVYDVSVSCERVANWSREPMTRLGNATIEYYFKWGDYK